MPAPEESQHLEQASSLIEYRSIRAGEKGGSHPIKTRPKVKLPMKNKGSNGFEDDKEVMLKAAKRLNLDPKDIHLVDAIPVFLVSDQVNGENGVIYTERAFYTGRGRLCGSAAGNPKALQMADVQAYSRNKSIKMLNEPREVDCTPDCPMWADPGKKSDCGWRAIITVQLADSPVFPSTVRFRTKSHNTIKYSNASLNAILREAGCLMGIPLWFKQYQVDKRDGEGKTRRIPIMTFEFHGTVQELREYGHKERQSRKGSIGVMETSISVPDTSFGVVDLDDIEHSESVDPGDDDDWEPGPDDSEDDPADVEIRSEIAAAAKEIGFAKGSLSALEAKHGGNLNAVLEELKSLSSSSKKKEEEDAGDWGPGEVGAEPSEQGEPDPDFDWDDEDF